MKKYNLIDAFFENKKHEDIDRFVEKNLDITEQIYKYLKIKGWSQSEFAKKLGKTNAEISKWLTGRHNLTLRSITKMEAILEEDIILTPQKAEKRYQKIQYITVPEKAITNQITQLNIDFSSSNVIQETTQKFYIKQQYNESNEPKHYC